MLWRQKEQFSDGVGYTWIDGLQDHAEKVVTDQQLAEAKYRSEFEFKPPVQFFQSRYFSIPMIFVNSGSRKRRPKPRRRTSIGTCSASTSVRGTPTPSGQSSGKTQLLAAQPQPSNGMPLSKTGLVTIMHSYSVLLLC